MAALDDQQKLRAEWLREDLETYRKLENWGASLFLGALGLLAKQLYEWDRAAATVRLDPEIVATPALVGLVAFVLLRVVNFRSHRVVRELAALAPPAPEHGGPSLGVLGFLLALMPGFFGYAVSWYLARCDAGRLGMLGPLWDVGGVVVLFAPAVHAVERSRG